MFTTDPEVAQSGAVFLRYVAPTFGFIGLVRVFTASLRGAGKTPSAAVIVLIVGPYESQLLGSVAFGWLLVFTAVIVAALLYSGVLWFRRRDSHNDRTQAETGGS